MTINVTKSTNNSALLAPKKCHTEGKASVQIEGMTAENQDNITTKQLVTQEIHANELHTNICHPREERIHTAVQDLLYIIKGTLEFLMTTLQEKKQKILCKAAEEQDLKPGDMINLYLSSKKKPDYGESNNWIIMQKSYKKKWSDFMKAREYLTEKVTPFLDKMKTMKKNVKKIAVTTQVKTGLSKKTTQKCSKELTLRLHHQALHNKMTYLNGDLLHYISRCSQ